MMYKFCSFLTYRLLSLHENKSKVTNRSTNPANDGFLLFSQTYFCTNLRFKMIIWYTYFPIKTYGQVGAVEFFLNIILEPYWYHIPKYNDLPTIYIVVNMKE